MTRRDFVIPGFAVAALSATNGFARTADSLHVFHHENVLGTSLALKFLAPSLAAAEAAEAAALSEFDRQSKVLSAYESTSEFRHWLGTSQQPVPVSNDLFTVLSLFDEWRTRTGGALDASAEVAGRVWKQAGEEDRVPTPQELSSAVATMQQTHWILDPAARTATRTSDAPLALHSFAKSYIISRAADAAMKAGPVSAAVVNVGGDIVVRGALAEPVQVANPLSDAENAEPVARLLVSNHAIATSGDYRRGVAIGGKQYSHLVDPRTGRPVGHIVSSTVMAPSATDAGALATAFSVLRPKESQALAAGMPGVEYLLIARDGQHFASKGWHRLPAFFAAAQSPPVELELVINLELARIDGQRYRRPYVAVWIDDKDKFPVRTLGLWFQKPRWLPDLKSWTHEDRIRSMAEGSEITATVSSATRPAGKYSLKWDGKDNQGKPVKPGKYTVNIEAAREHGSYQLIRQEIEFPGIAKLIPLPGNTEIASASLEYRKANAR